MQRKVRDFKEKMLESPEMPSKTLGSRIGGGMTCSANELQKGNGFDSQKEMYSILNKNSARGSGIIEKKVEDTA